MTTRKSPIYALAACFLLFAMALLLIAPARYGPCILDGISLWAASVLPAAFPFLFLTALFSGLPAFRTFSRGVSGIAGRVFRISGGGGAAFFLSALSGYPVGARTVADLAASGGIGKDELFRVAAVATTSGPAFLVGAVGYGMFARPAVGWLLLFSHLTGILLTGFLLRFRANPCPQTALLPTRASSLSDALTGSVLSILTVGGAIALFYTFGQMLSDVAALLSLPPALSSAARGLLEMTAGCAMLASSPSPLSVAGCAFLVTFGGLCVIVQELTFLRPAGVKTAPFLMVKLFEGGIAALVCYPLALLL